MADGARKVGTYFVDYTVDEYYMLLNMYRDEVVLEVQDYLDGMEDPFLAYLNSAESCYMLYINMLNDIRGIRSDEILKWFQLLFMKEIEDLPLLINSPDRVTRIIAKWRLEVAR